MIRKAKLTPECSEWASLDMMNTIYFVDLNSLEKQDHWVEGAYRCINDSKNYNMLVYKSSLIFLSETNYPRKYCTKVNGDIIMEGF